MKQLHYIQLEILRKLLFAKGLHYSELKPNEEIENSHFSFHLKELIKHKLIQKSEDLYSLTNKGKEYANRMDIEDNAKIKIQAKISAVFFCVRNLGNENEYLIYTRLKQPFYGSQGFPSGKIRFGEGIYEACRREMKEETNLEGDPELFQIAHFRVYSKKTEELLEDKFMYMFRILNPKGELRANSEGKHEWVKESELKTYFTQKFDGVDDDLKVLKNFDRVNLKFKEEKHFTDKF